MLAYLRASMIHKQDEKRREHLLLSTPVDPDFELIVIACAIQLLENFVKARFKTSIAEDNALLKTDNVSSRLFWAIRHRIDCKTILEANIALLQILVRILAKLQFASVKCAQIGQQMTRWDFKKIYMERVDQFETPEEVVANRMRLRKYLKELLMN